MKYSDYANSLIEARKGFNYQDTVIFLLVQIIKIGWYVLESVAPNKLRWLYDKAKQKED